MFKSKDYPAFNYAHHKRRMRSIGKPPCSLKLKSLL